MTYKRLLGIEASIIFLLFAIIIGLLLFVGLRIIQSREIQLQAERVEKNLIRLNYDTRSILLETGFSLEDMNERLIRDINIFESSLQDLESQCRKLFREDNVPQSLNLARKLWQSSRKSFFEISHRLEDLINSGFGTRFGSAIIGLLRYNIHIPQSSIFENSDHSLLLKLENSIDNLAAEGLAYEYLMIELNESISQQSKIYSVMVALISGSLIFFLIIAIVSYILFYSRHVLIRKIDYLLSKEVEREKTIRLAQIKALRYQINPHFILNTMTSVRFIAESEESPQTVKIIKSFSFLLKETLCHISETISLTEELRILEHYLTILQLRYDQAIKINWVVLEDSDNYYLLPSIIQPIVENAVMHGLSSVINNREEAILTIKAEIKDKRLIISVNDNGIGIDKHKMSTLFQSDPLEDASHLGLVNVRDRIQLHYGDDFGINVNSQENGTIIYVTLPILKERQKL